MSDYPSTFDATVAVLQSLAALAGASGVVGVAVRYFQSKGLDMTALMNNKLVLAAEHGAEAAVLDLMVKGKSLSDPQVLSDVTLALKASLQESHAGTIGTLGASAQDVERVASNAIGKVAKAALLVQAPAETDDSGATPSDPLTSAVETVIASRVALTKLAGPTVPMAQTVKITPATTAVSPLIVPPAGG